MSGNKDSGFLEEDSFWFRHREHCITHLAQKFQPLSPFVDIGGGNGFLSLTFQKLGLNTILVEPGTQGIELALRRGVKRVIQCSFSQVKIKEAKIPSAGLFDVLEHIENDLDFLKDLNHKIVKGGRLFLTVPAEQILWSDADVYTGHFRRYSKKELHQKLIASGFEPEFTSHLFFILVPAIFLKRTVPYFLGLSKMNSSQTKLKSDHLTKTTFLKTALCNVLELEETWLKNGRIIPWGTSLISVSKKS